MTIIRLVPKAQRPDPSTARMDEAKRIIEEWYRGQLRPVAEWGETRVFFVEYDNGALLDVPSRLRLEVLWLLNEETRRFEKSLEVPHAS